MLAGKLDMPEDEAEVWLVSRELTLSSKTQTSYPKSQTLSTRPQCDSYLMTFPCLDRL